MKRYMHTINGKPAQFSGKQIVFASVVTLEKDLATIRKQQKETLEYRKKQGFPEDEDECGYVIVEV